MNWLLLPSADSCVFSFPALLDDTHQTILQHRLTGQLLRCVSLLTLVFQLNAGLEAESGVGQIRL